MRVLVFSYEYPPFRGGAGVYAWELARGMGEAGAHVAVLAASWPVSDGLVGDGPGGDEEAAPCLGTSASVHRFGGRETQPALVALELERVRALEGTDLVLIADRRAQELVASLPRPGFPYVVTLHGTEIWWYFDPERSPVPSAERRERAQGMLRRAEGIVAVSRATADLLLSYAPELAPRTRVVHNGISEDRCVMAGQGQVDGQRKRLRLEREQVILTVGRLDRDKGQDVALRAFRHVVQEIPQAVLVLVGDGPRRSQLEQLAAELGIANRTRFLGEIGEVELSACLGLCDVFLLSSRCEERFEGLGLVFLEAGARGKPVVAGAVGGVPEAVADGENGLLVDPDDTSQVAAALLRLLGDEDERQRMGACGRRRVHEYFNSERMARETLEFLATVSTELPHGHLPPIRRGSRLSRAFASTRSWLASLGAPGSG